MIYIYYLITRWKELGKLKGKEYVVKTIVSTEVMADVAAKTTLNTTTASPVSNGLQTLCAKNEGIKTYIGGGERATDSLLKILCATKTPFLHVL